MERAVGEAVAGPVAAVIANAVLDAIRVRVRPCRAMPLAQGVAIKGGDRQRSSD
jgi:CO/xanthine dehydrogenase Mo-binding subunit